MPERSEAATQNWFNVETPNQAIKQDVITWSKQVVVSIKHNEIVLADQGSKVARGLEVVVIPKRLLLCDVSTKV